MKKILLTFLAISCFAPPKQTLPVPANNSPNPELAAFLGTFDSEIPETLPGPEPQTRPSSTVNNFSAQIEEILQIIPDLSDETKQFLKENLTKLSNSKFPPNASLKDKITICENLGTMIIAYNDKIMHDLHANLPIGTDFRCPINFITLMSNIAETVDSIILQNDPENFITLFQARRFGELKAFTCTKLTIALGEQKKEINEITKSQKLLQQEIASMKEFQTFLLQDMRQNQESLRQEIAAMKQISFYPKKF